MDLIIAEKPKVANKIAHCLSEGSSTAKKYKQVTYYEFEKDGKDYAVAPAVGHLYTLTEKKKSFDYPVFNIEWVPSCQVSESSKFTKPYVDIIKKLGKDAKSFTSACDYDVEGSLIGYNVFRFLCGGKPAQRMKFSALTPADIKEAFENKTELDYNNAYAGEARHILDWYYGINLSRALMNSLKRVHKFKIMSVGRVQGPT
ncbi:DNA topoisomerase I, partial [Candidatus Micrarchaeota archaeon]|nr:DNA topoisomerase I [Candidatus Micrarchaeota archaeon]